MMKKIFVGMFALGALTPRAALAAEVSANYQFARQGVFGCNQTGAYGMSVGSLSAVGGIYVPVNDAAVTLNTGYLVYKECVLRGVVDRESESAGAGYVKRTVLTLATGRNGNPMFPQNLRQEQLVNRADPDNLYFLKHSLGGLNPAFRTSVTRALARNYVKETRDPADAYTCPYRGDMRRVWNGEDDSDEARAALRDTRCDPLFAYYFAKEAQDDYAAQGQAEMMWRLTVSGGFYDVEHVDDQNQHIILTPGSFVRTIGEQALTSGFRRVENANDIDQMIGALFAGIGTQIVSSSEGLVGLTQRIGTQPSYLDQVAAEASSGLRNAAANAALQILRGALQVETAYNKIMNDIAQTLTAAIAQVRSLENQCWDLIVQNVCAAPPGADKTCAAKSGERLRVATSTAFSQQAIASQITPLANRTIANIQKSDKALAQINDLVAGVTNTSSVDAQRLALIQLDQLVADGSLHSQTDLTTAQQQQAAIKDAMGTLVSDTKTAWGDSTDPNVGWCNVNNQNVIQTWIARWKI